MRQIYYCPANTEDNKEEFHQRLRAFGEVQLATTNYIINQELLETLDDSNDDIVIFSLGTLPDGEKRAVVGRGVYSCVAHAERLRLQVFFAIIKNSRLWFKQANISSLTGEQDHRRWGYVNLSSVYLSTLEVFNERETALTNEERVHAVKEKLKLKSPPLTTPPSTILRPGVCAYYKQFHG